MPRKQSQYLQIDGPVFDDAMERKVTDAVAEGIEEAGDEAAGILVGFIAQAGFVDSGAFMRSVDSDFRRRSSDETGYAKVYPTASWGGTITLGATGAKTKSGKARIGVVGTSSSNSRPTRTWFERGERGGKKLRKASGGFSKTARHMQGLSYSRMEEKIARVLS